MYLAVLNRILFVFELFVKILNFGDCVVKTKRIIKFVFSLTITKLL